MSRATELISKWRVGEYGSIYNVLTYSSAAYTIPIVANDASVATASQNTESLTDLKEDIAAAGKGIIYFPAGTYTFQPKNGVGSGARYAVAGTSDTVYNIMAASNINNVRIVGDGWNNTIITIVDMPDVSDPDPSGGADIHIFRIKGNNWGFANLQIDGNKATYTQEQCHAIYLFKTTNVWIERVKFVDVQGDGVFMIGGLTEFTSHVSCRRSWFVGCDRSGLTVQSSIDHITITDNYFDNTSDQDVDFEPTGGGPPNNVWIERNTSTKATSQVRYTIGNSANAIPSYNVYFRNNYIKEGCLYAVNLSYTYIDCNVFVSGFPPGVGGEGMIMFNYTAWNNEIRNNIIHSTASRPPLNLESSGYPVSIHHDITFDRNIVINEQFHRVMVTGLVAIDNLFIRDNKLFRPGERLILGTVTSGPFQVGETITGSTSGTTGTCSAVDGSNVYIDVGPINSLGAYIKGETVTGGTSGASAPVANKQGPLMVVSNNYTGETENRIGPVVTGNKQFRGGGTSTSSYAVFNITKTASQPNWASAVFQNNTQYESDGSGNMSVSGAANVNTLTNTNNVVTANPTVNEFDFLFNGANPDWVNVWITNWEGLTGNITVDISSITNRLVPGRQYEVRDIGNYFGAAVASFTYSNQTSFQVTGPIGDWHGYVLRPKLYIPS